MGIFDSILGSLKKDPLDWLKAGGQVAGGIAQGQQSAAEIAERKREFDAAQRLREMQAGTGLATAQANLPLQDRVRAMLMARIGQSPGAYQPHDLTTAAGAGPAQPGGINLGALQQANAAYQPGQGGTGDQSDLYAQLLKKLGYG